MSTLLSNQTIPMSSAELDDSDLQAVVEVVKSGRLALGAHGQAFEKAMAAYCGVKHAIAVNSGTAALHLIVRALGLKKGDEVLVPSFTFAASVNALLYEGVTPVFIECESETYNLDVKDLERKITPRTKAIMVVDVFGHPADWDAIQAVAKAHNLKIIDDCCEALGAEYKGKKLGGFGDAGAFAFYPNKQMTTGEGGIIVTNDDEVARLCRSMANQGRGDMGAWLVHERLGFNYRLDEMSSALGTSQLRRLESFLQKREAVAQSYNRRIKNLSWVSAPKVLPNVRMSWFVYVVTLAEGMDRDKVMTAMEANGVPARGYFSPVHTQPYIKEMMGDLSGTLPVTEAIAQRTLALPFHNNLTDAEVDRVITALEASVR
jgi:perosamine synthetase